MSDNEKTFGLYLDHHSAQQPRRLWALIAASKEDDPLAPVTVVGPSNYANLSLRHESWPAPFSPTSGSCRCPGSQSFWGAPSLAATVQSGTGYTIGSPASAATAVQDNDLPPAPTGLRANGHIVGGQVSIWWKASTGATAYDLRYAVETCPDTPQRTASVCAPGSWTQVNGITATNRKTERRYRQ